MDNDDRTPRSNRNESGDAPKNLFEFFRSSPLVGANLDLERIDDSAAGTVPRARELGVDSGNVHIGDDFDAPNDDIANLFEGS